MPEPDERGGCEDVTFKDPPAVFRTNRRGDAEPNEVGARTREGWRLRTMAAPDLDRRRERRS